MCDPLDRILEWLSRMQIELKGRCNMLQFDQQDQKGREQ